MARSVVLDVGSGPAGHSLDHLGAQFRGGGPSYPSHQLVRLVDDYRVMRGQCRTSVHRIDCQQGVIGDNKICGSGGIP